MTAGQDKSVSIKLISKREEQNWFNNLYGLKRYIELSLNLTRIQWHQTRLLFCDNPDGNDLDLSHWPTIKTSTLQCLPALQRSNTNDDDANNTTSHPISTIIHHLKLRHCPNLGDDSLTTLFKKCAVPSSSPFVVIQKLDVSGCRNIGDETLRAVATYAGNHLQVLDVSDCHGVTDRGVVEFLSRGCRYLRVFRIRNNVRLGDAGVGAVRHNVITVRVLRVLDFAGCTGFSNEALIQLLESDCGVIELIDLSRCAQIDLGLIGLRKCVLSSRCKTMKLSQILMGNGCNISDSFFSWIAQGSKSLTHLDLSDNICLTDENLVYLSQGCRRLKTLILKGCYNITDRGLSALIQSMGKHLREINLQNCNLISDKGLMEGVASACTYLENLNLMGVPRVTDEGLTELAKGCRLLRYLDLSGDIHSLDTSHNSRIPHVTEVGLIALGRYCVDLKSFKCTGASRVEDVGVMELVKGPGGGGRRTKRLNSPQLVTLSLRYCSKITNASLEAIGKRCPNLTSLDIGLCRNVTDRGIIALSTGCARLTHLDVLGLTRLTDAGVMKLATRCILLESFTLRNCHRVTDASVTTLSRCCPRLTKLDLQSLDRVSDVSAVAVADGLFYIRWIDFSFTNVTDEGGFAYLMRRVQFAQKVVGKLALRPLHGDSICAYRQHVKYRAFLDAHQIKLSTAIRTHLARKRYQKTIKSALHCCITLQKLYRGSVARQKARHLLSIKRHILSLFLTTALAWRALLRFMNDKVGECVRIQAVYRGYICRLKLKRVRLVKETMRLSSSCFSRRKIVEGRKHNNKSGAQSNISNEHRDRLLWSSWMSLKWLQLVQRLLRNRQMLMAFSALIVQRWWRRLLPLVRRKRTVCVLIRVQRIWRQKLSQKQQQLHDEKMRHVRDEACRMIQRALSKQIKWNKLMARIWREHNERKAFNASLSKLALKLEDKWIRYKLRRDAMGIAHEKRFQLMHERQQFSSARLIQTMWRRHVNLQMYTNYKRIINNWTILFDKHQKTAPAKIIQKQIRHILWKRQRSRAAITLQLAFKNYLHHMRLRRAHILIRNNSTTLIHRNYRAHFERQNFKKQRAAIHLIQKHYRRHKAHKSFLALLRERAASHSQAIAVQKRMALQRRNERLQNDVSAAARYRHLTKSARLIQRSFRYHSREQHLVKRRLEKKEEAMRDIRDVALSRARAKERKRKEGSLPAKAKRGLGVLAGVPTLVKDYYRERKQRMKEMDDAINQSVLCYQKRLFGGQHLEKEEEENRHANATTSSRQSEKKNDGNNNDAVNRKKHKTNNDNPWHKDYQVTKVMTRYWLSPKEVSQMYTLFCRLLCENDNNANQNDAMSRHGEKTISVIDFFDSVDEPPKSTYGLWLLQIVLEQQERDQGADESNDENGTKNRPRSDDHASSSVSNNRTKTISFATYLHANAFYCLFGKTELYRLLFAKTDVNENGYLEESEWVALVEAVTGSEVRERGGVRRSTTPALKAFSKFAVSIGRGTAATTGCGEKLLFFNEFCKILDLFPFIAFPLFRLQLKMRERHLGSKFWQKKKDFFASARKKIGEQQREQQHRS